MRGTFGIVLAAGVAAAVGWSMFRRSGEDASAPEPELPPRGVQVSADEPAVPAAAKPAPVQQPEVRSGPVAAQVAAFVKAGDQAAAAKAILAADRRELADAGLRARALEIAAALADEGDRASATRAGIDARILARKVCAAVYDQDSATAAERTRAFDLTKTLLDVLVRGNGAPPELCLRHKVEAGQSVWALAKGPWKQAGVTAAPGFILAMNGISDPRRLRAGQSLRVPLEPVTVLVRKRSFELVVLLGGSPVERFTVAVGADAKTPVGAFSATDCLKNPDWYMNGRRIPFGAPEHIIGTRWIGLGGAAEADGIGIHGTNDETTIGKAVSLGCVRMRNADVEKLFDWIATGTRVEIRD